MTYRGHVKNGQITLDEPANLPEGAEVNIEVEDGNGEQPTIWKKLKSIAGSVEGPNDWADNIDHYLYGLPKRNDRDNTPINF